MADDQNIDPLKDIDFESMGVMTQFDSEPGMPEAPPADEEEGEETPPAKDDSEEEETEPAADDSEEEEEEPAGDDEEEEEEPEEGEDDDEETEEEEEPESEETPASVVSEVIDLVGFEDMDAEQYDDSVEGIGKLIQDASEKLASQQWEATLEQYPDVKEYFEYVASGGDPNKYHEVRGQAFDYEQMTIDEENEPQQETIVRQALKGQEHDQEEIDAIVEKYKAGGILKDQAEMALKGLKRQAAKQKETLTQQQQELAQQQQQQVEEFWDTVETTLKEKDNFKGITIPKNERQKFLEYVSKPVKDGYSQRDLDALELDLDAKIAIDYLIMKGFPLSDIVDKKAGTKAASDLRKRLKSGGDPKPRKTQPPKPARKDGKASIADLDLM